MTKDMMKRIKKNKENAVLLIRYANSKSKSKPTEEEVLEILYRYIPYCGTRPAIKSFTVFRFNRNKIIKCAYFVVELDNGKTYEISAYQDLSRLSSRSVYHLSYGENIRHGKKATIFQVWQNQDLS